MNNLIISFPDQSTSFCNGVEYGRILTKIENGDECISNNNFPVRIENIALLKETCKVYGYTVNHSDCIDGWVHFIAIKKTFSNN